MDFKFIHAADIHLDSPIRGLERYQGAPVKYGKEITRKAFRNLIELAIKEEVDFLLIAGDLYDGDWRDFSTALFFVHQMSRLRESGIKVIIVRGNHDAASQISRRISLPDNVHELSSSKPETFLLKDSHVAIHGQSYPHRSVEEDLSRNFPAAQGGCFNIGLLHTCASGREGHENYAPCSVPALQARGYDYWALGHIHKREILSRDPWIVFSGNIQGRNTNETGDKGCTLVTVKNGRVQAVEHQSLDVMRYALCEVDVTASQSYEDVIDMVGYYLERELSNADGRILATRVVLTGMCKAHKELIRSREQVRNDIKAKAIEIGHEEIWIEKVKIETRSDTTLSKLAAGDELMRGLVQLINALPEDPGLRQELLDEFEPLVRLLPDQLKQDMQFDFQDEEAFRSILSEVEDLLTFKLADKEVG